MVDLLYAVGDLHGEFDIFQEILEWIEKDAAGEDHTVVFLGDYIDRGPNSKDIVEALYKGPTLYGAKWVCLMGNHELMMMECLAGKADMVGWLKHGGTATLISYGAKVDSDCIPARLIPRKHKLWFEVRPLYHIEKPFAFAHAAFDPSNPLSQQSVNTLLWGTAQGERMFPEGKSIIAVHGHTVNLKNPRFISEYEINLDAGSFSTGKVGVMRAIIHDASDARIALFAVGGGVACKATLNTLSGR